MTHFRVKPDPFQNWVRLHEDFEGVGEVEDFGGELREVGLKVEAGGSGEGTGAELFEGVHA